MHPFTDHTTAADRLRPRRQRTDGQQSAKWLLVATIIAFYLIV